MSRFVAAGGAETDDAPKDAAREDAWAKAQQQLEALRTKPKPRAGEQEDGKSLYEVLQANKAAKQSEFEEQAKLKNQFRALDDDEVDFLDAIVSSEKAKEAAVRKETAEELESFRKQQQQAEKASTSMVEEQTTPDAPAANAWRAKKRRRKEADIPISKVRKTTTDQSTSPGPAATDAPKTVPPAAAEPAKKQSATALGLAYASDSDDD